MTSARSSRILISGAGGFLSRFVAQAFRHAGWQVHGISRHDSQGNQSLFTTFSLDDLGTGSVASEMVRELQPDLILHLASPASVPNSLRSPAMDLHGHLAPLSRLLESARLYSSSSKLLLVSSAAVYGNPLTLPIREDMAAAPISPYGFHKYIQELLCDEYRLNFGLASSKARVFSTFGEGQRQLAVWEITKRALAGDFSVGGSGGEIRDYLYAADVAAALLTIAEHAAFEGEVINVGSGNGLTIRDLASMIFRGASIADTPKFTGVNAPATPTHWEADVTALRKLGFVPSHALEPSLQRTIEWIRDES